MRHFNLITYTELSDSSIKAIFLRKVTHFLSRFSDAVKVTIPTIVNSSINLYKEIKSTLLPTPKNSHYLFNLRDMAKALQGVCSVTSKYTNQKIDILRLWVHEMTRAFGDRLICDEDRKWLKDLMDNNIFNEFAVEKSEFYNVEKIIFCDFVMGSDKPYVQVTNIKQFITKIEENLNNYNDESKGKPMRLVMFLDACDHVARICRIIRQTQGHALLLGVGGSGRQSLARLSSYINSFDCFQIEVNKGYTMNDFKKNLKDCLKEAGLKEKPLCFLICDTQIFNENILEDLNNCLNSGDVPEIYKPDDLDEIKSACKSDCSRKNLPETPTNIFNMYLSRVKANIHLMFAMSPMSEEFTTRIRMFPSLVNCCTIDWFTEWPDEALQSVAKDSIESYDLKLGLALLPVINSIKFIHKSVEQLSKDFLNELRRYNYLTPTSFLEFLLLFKTILESKREYNEFNINRLEMGLTVLDFAGTKIENIEKEIKEKQPKLERTTIEVNEYIIVVSVQKEEADKVKEVATEEKRNAEELNKKITEINEICQRELSKAEDQLQKSLSKIENIDDAALLSVGRLSSCSAKMEKLLELLLIFKTGNAYKNKKANFVQTGDHKNPLALNVLTAAKNDLGITSVSEFKGFFYSFKQEEVRDKLKSDDLYKVNMAKEFIEEHKIDREYAEKAAGAIVACFDFVLAMADFCYNSINIVDPKKKEAEKAKHDKIIVDEKLRKAENELRTAEDKASKLEKTYNEKVKEKNDLAFELSENQIKLERAKALVGLLSGEKQRWGENVETMKKYSALIIGDCLIGAAMIAYSGAFTSTYRMKMEESWKKKLDVEGILKSPNASLRYVMEEKLQTRKWNLNFLPNDNLSIENGIIMFKTRKWPLMIDPQNQASIFLKKYGNSVKETSFISVKFSDPKMIDQVISGVKFGQWILLDNVGTHLDASLEPILLQQKIKRGNYCEIKIGDKLIPYNEEFKLLMITTLSNPHYSPETFAKITIINFAITPFGLEDQMLSELVKIEMPELEENKNRILEENFKSQEILKDIEDKILDNLSKNKDNIEETLKSSDLIDILTEAKTKSKEIGEKLILSEKTAKEIDTKRELYRPSALRASILFFILLDLSFIDHMYQYSLIHYKRLFENTVRMLPPCDDIQKRISDINKKFSKDFYDNTSRSLFEKDKILFSFVMSVKILMGEKGDEMISPTELRFLLAGPPGDLEFHLPDNPTKWISSTDWRSFYSQLYGMSKLHSNFEGFAEFFMKNHDQFKKLYESPKNEITPLPNPWNEKLTEFHKLIVIKAIRNDKLINSIINYVDLSIGKEFTEPPAFDLNSSFKETNYTIPLLFVLSTGSDPINDLKSLAESYGRKIEFVSLGKSMDKIALSKIEDVKLKGGWIILQNCHLSLSFLPKLEDVIEQLQSNNTIDSNFRLWLTSMSSPHFSINISKLSIKITMEPPKGLKLNLTRQFYNIRDEDLEACSKPDLFKSFFFSLCFFHAIVQDRRKFGPIGWNVKYDFTNEDLIVSRKQLKNFLEEYENVPYKVLNYLGAEINYGGRITDDKDQRLIRTIFLSYINPNVLQYQDFKFSSSGIYYCPPPGGKLDYLEYIKGLPLITSPEVFGLHDNAEITTAQNDASLLLETVLGMQPRTSSGGGKSLEQSIQELLIVIEKETPLAFDYEEVFGKYPTEYTESMNTVLIQEVIRYNVLLIRMDKDIKTLKKALSGKIVMSDDMERIATSLYNNQVPQVWIKLGFLSLKPLMSWLLDLKDRIDFFNEWIEKGTPKSFCLPSNINFFKF
jgi:dynein heavy chain